MEKEITVTFTDKDKFYDSVIQRVIDDPKDYINFLAELNDSLQYPEYDGLWVSFIDEDKVYQDNIKKGNNDIVFELSDCVHNLENSLEIILDSIPEKYHTKYLIDGEEMYNPEYDKITTLLEQTKKMKVIVRCLINKFGYDIADMDR